MSAAPTPTTVGRTTAATTRARAATVDVRPGARLEDLLNGLAPGEVFTRREQRLSGMRSDLTGWAGRLAAKRAVAALVGAVADQDLHRIEIVPDSRGLCGDDPTCMRSHPPRVQLDHMLQGRLAPGEQIGVSISHTRTVAIALAVRYSERTVGEA